MRPPTSKWRGRRREPAPLPPARGRRARRRDPRVADLGVRAARRLAVGIEVGRDDHPLGRARKLALDLVRGRSRGERDPAAAHRARLRATWRNWLNASRSPSRSSATMTSGGVVTRPRWSRAAIISNNVSWMFVRRSARCSGPRPTRTRAWCPTGASGRREHGRARGARRRRRACRSSGTRGFGDLGRRVADAAARVHRGPATGAALGRAGVQCRSHSTSWPSPAVAPSV